MVRGKRFYQRWFMEWVLQPSNKSDKSNRLVKCNQVINSSKEILLTSTNIKLLSSKKVGISNLEFTELQVAQRSYLKLPPEGSNNL